jgi:GrpB-like predicted nucleotidyltransferase (UPF0157 family)
MVRLEPYSPVWKTIFQRDADSIRNAIGEYVIDIQHVGSTSIEGLDAKPVIDIAIGVESLDCVDDIATLLQPLGYLRLRVKIDGKVVFAKDTESGRTHYLHLETYRGDHWNDHLLFRDYLWSHPEALESYRQLKWDIVKEFGTDVGGYTDRKKLFVDEILRTARSEQT